MPNYYMAGNRFFFTYDPIFVLHVWKCWQHGFWSFGEKSQNIMCGSEKYKLTGSNSGEERFDSVFWKNKVDGTQNFDISWKSALEVTKPTIENRKYHENPIDS